jgi:imidazole glycerol-phosphate synthase subunit HisF
LRKLQYPQRPLRILNLFTRRQKKVGNQSVVVVIDIKYNGILKKQKMLIMRGNEILNIDLFKFIKQIEDLGAGEIVINCIDRDGTKLGYDVDLITKIRSYSKVILTLLGGAGSYGDIKNLVSKVKAVGCAAGSLFVFKGKYDTVLISYLDKEDKDELKKLF